MKLRTGAVVARAARALGEVLMRETLLVISQRRPDTIARGTAISLVLDVGPCASGEV